MINVTALSDDNFDAEVKKASRPVVVEFWTEGCKPCQQLGKVVRRFADQLKVVTCDIDAEPGLAERFGVMNVPTLLFFRSGELVDRAIGTVNDISVDEVAAICRRITTD